MVSCENLLIKDLELEDFDFEKQLVLNASLNSSSDSMVVFVSENISILETEQDIIFIDNAEVDLFFEGQKIADLKLGDDSRYYHYFGDSIRPVGEYELVINHPTYSEARAITHIPEDVPILDFEYIEDAGFDPLQQIETSAVRIKFKDPPGNNYYSFQVFSDFIYEDTFIQGIDTFIFENEIYIDTSIDDPNVITTQENSILLTDELFNDKEYILNIKIVNYNGIDPSELKDYLKFKWEVLSEDYFNYETSLNKYYQSSDFGLFSEPVTIHTNVENGLGIFAGFNRKIFRI
jgi:hypothetical protein